MGCHSALLSRSLGCQKVLISFLLSVFGHWSPGLACLPGHHENHLIWVDLSLMAPLSLGYFIESLCQHSCSLASLPSHYENHLIWVDLSLMALPLSGLWPLFTRSSFPAWLPWEPSVWVDSALVVLFGFHVNSPLSFSWDSFVGQSLLNVYCALFTFCSFDDWIFSNTVWLIPLLSDHYNCCSSDPGMYSRYFGLVNNIYVASLLNKNHTSQDLRLFLSQYRVSEDQLTPQSEPGIYRTNISDQGWSRRDNKVKSGHRGSRSLFINLAVEFRVND